MTVWIITFLLYGKIQVYSDYGVYATKLRCEGAVSAMKEVNREDEEIQSAVCREVSVHP